MASAVLKERELPVPQLVRIVQTPVTTYIAGPKKNLGDFLRQTSQKPTSGERRLESIGVQLPAWVIQAHLSTRKTLQDAKEVTTACNRPHVHAAVPSYFDMTTALLGSTVKLPVGGQASSNTE